MKKHLLTVLLTCTTLFSAYSQEMATSSGDGKKIYVGLSGVYYIAMDQSFGVGFHGSYSINNKISIGATYNFSLSSVEVWKNYKTFPTSNQPEVGKYTANNYNHYVDINGKYYVYGSSEENLGVFAGLGVAYSVSRSTEYGPVTSINEAKNSLGVWKGIYLPITAGVDYQLGPGKVFGSFSFAPRLFKIGSSPDSDLFDYLVITNIGYKIGF